MSKLTFVAAVAALTAAILAPGLAEARGHHRYHRSYANPLPYPISYLHNYGPGITPGTFDDFFLVQMPLMGMGVLASATATPALIIGRTLVHHSSFGLGLAIGAMLTRPKQP